MTGSELLESCSTDCCGLSTTGSGAITGLNVLTATKVQTSEFTRVNGSAVISAGCGCGPSADSATASDKCECKSGVNVEHYIPVQQVTPKRIHHQNALVANHKFGPNENQVRSQDEEQRPKSGCCGGSKIAGEPGFNSHDSANQHDNCCVDVAASRSEGLLISHKPIIAGDK